MRRRFLRQLLIGFRAEGEACLLPPEQQSGPRQVAWLALLSAAVAAAAQLRSWLVPRPGGAGDLRVRCLGREGRP